MVGRGSIAGLAAGLVDVQAGIKVGLDLAEDLGDLVRSGSFSHGSLPGCLPVVRFPLRPDQVLGGRPVHPVDPVKNSLFSSSYSFVVNPDSFQGREELDHVAQL